MDHEVVDLRSLGIWGEHASNMVQTAWFRLVASGFLDPSSLGRLKLQRMNFAPLVESIDLFRIMLGPTLKLAAGALPPFGIVSRRLMPGRPRSRGMSR